ncbi:YceI family protein [Psychrobacter jeotgali]|uniref:YceI family protein n=1 Tax=Psychrobacter jeotgali TaxID=179010 RepID=UPI00191A6AA5|nr:YceI family protein [Psychrobacter jeotgali]
MSIFSFNPLASSYRQSIAALLLLMIAGIGSGVGSSQAATYHLDPTHTNVRFAIDHFNTSTNTGGFYNLTGQLEYDPSANVGNISLLIPVNSLNTGNKAFDITLKGADFFDTEKYPLAYFKSTKWHFANKKAGAAVTKVEGDLTLRGITNPVVLTATKFNCYFNLLLKKPVCGGDFTTTIDRSQWNLDKYTLLGITEKVDLDIQIEAAKQ